nr:extracellular solute-binding protein [Lachnospiraceae bacterium]
GGTYALPETMNFNVLFYRKDILSDYGIDLPDTRADLYDYVLPALYQKRLEFYFGRDFTQFLFQNGGSFYTEDGMKSALDTPEAYQAFKEYTELFTNYGVPKTANFYQRMRSGITALGVGDFNTYMQLSVGAPEIAGKWGIAPLPGVMKENGEIDRSAGAITEKGDIIMKQSKKPEQSWKFLKWWTSAEVQSTFAKEVEALMGAESRWNTANVEAFLSLDWDDEDISTLEEQWKWARETPVLLGSYMTQRHLTNAWTTVVISGGNVREALEQAVKDINREMRSKQEEYGVIADE